MMDSLKTFIINLEKRTDRKKHISNEFNGRLEFELRIVTALENDIGSISLWNTIKYILTDLLPPNLQFFILCEDDHIFTENYNKRQLYKCISTAQERNADILLGGISWFDYSLQILPNLFWVNKFTGLQFTIIFRKFYETILSADFKKGDDADFKISSLSDKIMVMYPYISIQKEFNYSDVTSKNEEKGRVTQLFESSLEKLVHLDTVAKFYELKFK